MNMGDILIMLIAVIISGLNVWFIGWGRHLWDKNKRWKVWLGWFVIIFFFLLDFIGVMAFFMLMDLKYFLGDI